MNSSFNNYMKTNIKEIISGYPEVGQILRNNGIGCSECSMGTCPLGEIVNVHGLTVEQEKELLTSIGHVLFPGKQIEIPMKPAIKTAKENLCPPIRKLINEHELILKFLQYVPKVCELFIKKGLNEELALNCIDFIKAFADGYHHAKEEAVLFSFIQNSNGIIESFITEHEMGRAHVKNIVDGIEIKSISTIVQNFRSYAHLLNEHIKKEDTILFPWINRVLTVSEVGILFSRCSDIDIEYSSCEKKMIDFVHNLQSVQ